ncbi:hypothetical protein ACFQMM_16100 [Saliphagus sp. GCM10025308]
MNRMLQNGMDHLEDVEAIREGPYQEKPGESNIEQFDTDQITEERSRKNTSTRRANEPTTG